jgi:hypothetical protein
MSYIFNGMPQPIKPNRKLVVAVSQARTNPKPVLKKKPQIRPNPVKAKKRIPSKARQAPPSGRARASRTRVNKTLYGRNTKSEDSQKTMPCGPGTILKDGECVPATTKNVFQGDRYTPGRAPPPFDYSCTPKKPNADSLIYMIQRFFMVPDVRTNYVPFERNALDVTVIEKAVLDTTGILFL